MIDEKSISRMVKESRKRKKLTLNECGELLGISKMHVHHMENGYRMPSYTLLATMCKKLGYTIHLIRNKCKQQKEK